MRAILKDFLPPFILKRYRSSKFPWKGDYHNWTQALDECTGYESEILFEKVLASAKLVADGHEKYERDGFIFSRPEYSFPLSTALLFAAVQYKHLRVLDFGGGLGSSFYQNKVFLDSILDLKWYIVEQGKLVDKINFKMDERIYFKKNVIDVASLSQINFVLFSSVLQYLHNPFEVIDSVLSLKPEIILIDRLSVNCTNRNIITKQTAQYLDCCISYPCTFFCRESILSPFDKDYELMADFPSFVNNDGILNNEVEVKEIGLLFRRKTSG